MNHNKTNDKQYIQWFILCIPFIYLLFSLTRLHLEGSFFQKSIDPEYAYLFNGLNCAILQFDHIGHVDHPGTPFQLLTGIFIWITYLIAGQGNITNDVFARPELYLAGCSFLLSLLNASTLFWLGKIVWRTTRSLWALIIMQSTLFLNSIMVQMYHRYIPDRFLPVLFILLIGLIIRYLYDSNFKRWKFALYSGLILGIGLVTKIHIIPILILPLLLVTSYRERLIYLSSLSISTVINFLPVHNHYVHFRNFITGIFTHTGLYGKGSQGLLDEHLFLLNIGQIFKKNIPLTVIINFAFIIFTFLLFNINLRRRYRNEFKLLISFFILITISILIIAKHYKNYYIVPVISFTSLIYYVVFKIVDETSGFKYARIFMGLIFSSLIFISVSSFVQKNKELKAIKIQNALSITNYKKLISVDDYLLIEPIWLSSPMIENSVVFGITYIAGKQLYLKEIENNYPNVLTWEGIDKPLRYFRIMNVDLECILKSGKNIFVYSSQGRNAEIILDYLEFNADSFNLELNIDTVFSNKRNNEYLIKVIPDQHWKTLREFQIGFEKQFNGTIYSDDETIFTLGKYRLDRKEKFTGNYSLLLDTILRNSPSFDINDVSENDIVEINIKCKTENNQDAGSFDIVYQNLRDSSISISERYFTSEKKGWITYKHKIKIDTLITDKSIRCYVYYFGKSKAWFDNILVCHIISLNNKITSQTLDGL